MHKLLTLMCVVAIVTGCALSGDPLKLGAGEGEALMQRATTKTTHSDGTVDEPVGMDGYKVSSDLLTDTWDLQASETYRAPEIPAMEALTALYVSRGANAGPLTPGEGLLSAAFLEFAAASATYENLSTRNLTMSRTSDAQDAAAVANARARGTLEAYQASLSTAESLATGGMTDLIDAASAAFGGVANAPPTTPPQTQAEIPATDGGE